jgi:hypothetical protein
MSNNNQPVAMAQNVEILSSSVGEVDGKPVIVLCVRLSPDTTPASVNLIISAEQAMRLQVDLASNFVHSELMGKLAPEYAKVANANKQEFLDALLKIENGEQSAKPTKKGRGKKK